MQPKGVQVPNLKGFSYYIAEGVCKKKNIDLRVGLWARSNKQAWARCEPYMKFIQIRKVETHDHPQPQVA